MDNIEQVIAHSLKLLKKKIKECKKSELSARYLAFHWHTNEVTIIKSLYLEYGIELSLDQRWLIFLSVLNETGRDIDSSLDYYLRGEVLGFYQYAEDENEKPREHTFLKPSISPLFGYALDNYETIWRKTSFVIEVREILNNWNKSIENKDRIAYQDACKKMIDLKPKSFYLDFSYRVD